MAQDKRMNEPADAGQSRGRRDRDAA
jgi:hypothetical protein